MAVTKAENIEEHDLIKLRVTRREIEGKIDWWENRLLIADQTNNIKMRRQCESNLVGLYKQMDKIVKIGLRFEATEEHEY
jgi:hypothetical protein